MIFTGDKETSMINYNQMAYIYISEENSVKNVLIVDPQ